MKYLTTFLIALSLTSLSKSNDKDLKKEATAYCKLAPLFGAKGDTKPTKYEDKKFCTKIKKTCCSSEDFTQLQKWWEDSFSKMSMVEKRAIEMRTLLGKFKLLKEYKDELQVRLERIKLKKKEGQPACVSPAHVMGNILRLGLLDTAVNHYEKSAKKCWTYTKDLMNALMCAACDADAQDEIIKEQSKITISTAECQLFTDNCLDHLKSLWALTHYLTYMNYLAFCDDNAEFKGTTDNMMMSSDLLQAINSCLHEKNVDDCMQVCRSEISFSTQVSFEHNNIERILKFLRRVEEEFGKDAAIKRKEDEAKKKQQAKRILADDNKGEKKAGEKVIDQYATLVKLNGLNLTEYTANNTDKFESLNIDLLFQRSWPLKLAFMIVGFGLVNLI